MVEGMLILRAAAVQTFLFIVLYFGLDIAIGWSCVGAFSGSLAIGLMNLPPPPSWRVDTRGAAMSDVPPHRHERTGKA